MSTSRVIEVGDITAGVVVEERPGQHRFYAAEKPFGALEPKPFASPEHAARAARALLTPPPPPRSAQGWKARTALSGYFI